MKQINASQQQTFLKLIGIVQMQSAQIEFQRKQICEINGNGFLGAAKI